ncbi:hypothetical protein [Methanohalophilus sp.]|uniref:hypothetical protein n=1 Tax=Methanohalophilus sp. TaxID=1966352 RepID=UPI00260E387F|nr:hypothetical protein [Methanohalophilus sp.]MDK2892174.1 hypothetical protein [Methanohalophilus sp.]
MYRCYFSKTFRGVFVRGYKVVFEVTIMVADSGCIGISKDTEIIAIEHILQ